MGQEMRDSYFWLAKFRKIIMNRLIKFNNSFFNEPHAQCCDHNRFGEGSEVKNCVAIHRLNCRGAHSESKRLAVWDCSTVGYIGDSTGKDLLRNSMLYEFVDFGIGRFHLLYGEIFELVENNPTFNNLPSQSLPVLFQHHSPQIERVKTAEPTRCLW